VGHRFLFVGGGTGGHLTPALGLAEALEARGHHTHFLVNGRSVEELYFSEGRTHSSLAVDSSALPRSLSLLPAMWRARRLAHSFQADLVIGLGGAGSVAALAARRGKPFVLLEGNHVFGKSVRWMQPFAQRILTQYPETAAQSLKGLCVGPLSRQNSASIPREEACRQFGFSQENLVLLVTGGSQGAAQVNDFLRSLMPRLALQSVQLLALCGPGKADDVRNAANDCNMVAHVLEHCDAMGAAWSAADFSLCRGGASTLAEAWLHTVPCAVIPYPDHADRQQEKNTQALGSGAFLLDPDQPQAADTFLSQLLNMDRRMSMAKSLRDSRPADGTQATATLLENWAAQGHASS